jgi:hypothetical protein
VAGTIVITRKSGFQLMPRAYKVWIDGTVAGTLDNNASAEFAVEPGEHLVELSLDGMYSKRVTVDVREFQTRRLHCGANKMIAFSAFAVLLPGLAIRLSLTH